LARIDTLVKFAGALELTPAELLAGLDWEPGPAMSGSFRVQGEAET
jgi:hypothetical protein